VKLVGEAAPVATMIVRDADGELVERAGVRWCVQISRGVVWTRGLRIGDRVEANGVVIVEATAQTVGRR
jgi:hypothetical protein